MTTMKDDTKTWCNVHNRREVECLREKVITLDLQLSEARESCAKISEDWKVTDPTNTIGPLWVMGFNDACQEIANQIRTASILPKPENPKCGVDVYDGKEAVSVRCGKPLPCLDHAEKQTDEGQVCYSCGWNNGPNHGGGSRVMYTVGKITKCGECLPTAR